MPNITENLYQIILTIGLFLLSYSYLRKVELYEKYRTDINNYNYLADSDNLKIDNNNALMDALSETAKDLSQKYGVKNPISEKDGVTTFNKINRGNKNEVIVSSIVDKLWQNHTKAKNELTSLRNINKRKYKVFDDDAEYHLNSSKEFNNFGIPVSFLFIFGGLIGLVNQQVLKDRILEKQIEDKEINFCHSCIKKFGATVQRSKFPDGEVNKYYCSECFNGTGFIDPELKAIDVIGRRLSSMESPTRRQKKRIKELVLSLNRWKKGKY